MRRIGQVAHDHVEDQAESVTPSIPKNTATPTAWRSSGNGTIQLHFVFIHTRVDRIGLDIGAWRENDQQHHPLF
jgi:hypothetical protein